MLGRRDDVPRRGVDHQDPELGRRLQVDVVEADPGPADDLQLLACRQQLPVDLRGRPDDEGVVAPDLGEELLPREPRLHLAKETGLGEDRQAGFRERLGDEDLLLRGVLPGHALAPAGAAAATFAAAASMAAR